MKVYNSATSSTYINDPDLSVTEFAGRRWRARKAEMERARRARYVREGVLRGLRARPEALKARDLELKVEVFSRYGAICYCCGEGELAFLTLDDPNGTRQIIDGPGLWGTLRKQNFPDEFVVVCFNCQMASMTLEGCPHRAGVREGHV